MPLLAGVDRSTQSTKALIVDADSGEVVASGRAPDEVWDTSAGIRLDAVTRNDAASARMRSVIQATAAFNS